MINTEISINNKESSNATYLQRNDNFAAKFNIFDLLVICICVASLVCSLIESTVNIDNYHWGGAYLQAVDLKRGFIPHSGVLIFYGYIYSWVQSVALSLFGERLISLGIITGLFYSLTLFLSYIVFLRFLNKNLAFISVLLIFLIHPYIIYPFPNYFAYTFQLLALICFLRYSQNHYYGFATGFFLCMSVLSRYSSAIAILPPFIILLCWEFLTVRNTKKYVMKKMGVIGSGFLIPLILFFIYLHMNSALDDFFYQNKMIIKLWGNIGDVNTYLNFLASFFQVVPSMADDFRGKLFTLIFIMSLFILIWECVQKYIRTAKVSEMFRYDIKSVCIVTIFGYLNSVHVYETFRLVNGSSLGIGLCVFVFYNIFIKARRPLRYFMISVSTLTFLLLSSTLFFTSTTSSYYPWRLNVLVREGVNNTTIKVFRGKILTKEYNDFYQEIFDAIEPYKHSCYILNYTMDCVAFMMNDLPRIQISTVEFPWLRDVSKQAKFIAEKKAVILSDRAMDFPGYKKIFNKQWPAEIPWLGGGYLFIYAPQL